MPEFSGKGGPNKVHPGQPTQFWTFSNVLSLLDKNIDQNIVDSINEFLIIHRSVITNANPLSSKVSDDIKPGTTEMTLHNILYTKINDVKISDAKKLSKVLKVDVKECVRIISQFSRKYPEQKVIDSSGSKSKIKSSDDRESILEIERLTSYGAKVLREKRTILELALELLSNKLSETVPNNAHNLGKDLFLSNEYFVGIIENLSSSFDALISKSFNSEISEEFNLLMYKETLLTVITLLKILVELSLNNSSLKVSSVLTWFKFLKNTKFTTTLNPNIKELESECLGLINALTSIISVALLDLSRNYGNEENSYINDSKAFKQINDIISDSSNQNSIIMYSWSIIALRKTYVLSEFPNNSFSTIEEIEASIRSLSVKCVQLDVFHEIDICNKTLSFDNLYATILASVIQAAMPLITLTPEIASTIANVLRACPNFIIEKFFENEDTTNAIIVSRAKFPHYLTQFLKLASINGTFALNELSELKSYTCKLQNSTFNNMTVIDDQNTDLVKLTKEIDIFPPYEINNKLSLLLNSDTRAKILLSTSDDELLIAFIYGYNGIAFLGRVLQNLSLTYDANDDDKIGTISDILDVLTQIIKDVGKEKGTLVIETMSAYIDGSDIVEIILRLLEQGLHSRNIKIAKAVFDLLYYLNSIASDRVWGYLSNSILLSDNGKAGFISIIFTSIEMINGEYDLTISFIKLTESLAHDCLLKSNALELKSKVLSQCISHLILVFEAFIHCRFNNSCQKMEIGSLILDTFDNILSIVHGLQNSSSKSKVNVVFIESAQLIVDSFLINKSNFSRTCYPLNSLIDSLEKDSLDYELKDTTGTLHKTWITCALRFAELIISIRTSLKLPPSSFETAIFNRVPTLVKSYANFELLRKDILNLLTALTIGVWPVDSHPSLLSHLGRDNTQILLNSMITDLENDLDNYNVKVAIYDFISAVMSGDQEGLCVLLLGVRDIVNNLTGKNRTSADQSLVKILRNNVRSIEYLPDSVALHLVDSMALVVNRWSSINSSSSESNEDYEFLDQLIKKVNYPIDTNLKTVDEYIAYCYKLKLVSKIFEVLALFLFSTKNDKIKTKISNFLTSKEFSETMNSSFVIKSYHSKLHNDLDKEFLSNCPNFNLSDFRCSLVKRNRFGVSTVYNLAVMDGMFSTNINWPQIREHVIASAVELQYLSAQIDVAKSLGALLTALCRKSPEKLSSDFIDFCIGLLKTNVDEGNVAEFFHEIYHTRIQICFFIVYTLYNLPSHKIETIKTFELLKTASELLSSEGMKFIENLSQSTGNYRPLLRITYCCLSTIQNETGILTEYFSIFRQLFELIINKGTNTLLVEIQNDVYLTKTKRNYESLSMNERINDILLVLSILKLFVEIKVSPNNQFEMAKIVEQNSLTRSLTSLYSFSHLIEFDGDYMFAQLSLMYIQELMKIDVLAQQFVEKGLFTVLQGSSISSTIKNGDINIVTSPQFHRIWTNGILPIFLYSLSSLGPSILPDVCFALTTFKKQIETCFESWAKDSSTIRITSATVNETSQLLLIYQILKKFNVTSYFNINIDVETANNVSDVPVLPGVDSEAKREDFNDYISNLLKHPKFLTSRIVASSIEEQRIIDNGGQAFDSFVKNLIDEIASLKDYLS